MDVWNYLAREEIELPSLYFAHEREVIWRNGSWIPNSEFLKLDEKERNRYQKNSLQNTWRYHYHRWN